MNTVTGFSLEHIAVNHLYNTLFDRLSQKCATSTGPSHFPLMLYGL